jgi:hypothetical protein
MALLNPHRLFFLFTERNTKKVESVAYCEHRHSTTGTMMRNWEDGDYFYIEYRQGNCFDEFKLEELMMPHELEALKQGKITLVLNNSHEAFHRPVEQLYKSLVLNQKIPAENILLMSESADIAAEIDRCATLFNSGKMKADWILQFEFNMKRDLLTNWVNNPYNETLLIKSYNKKFLNFNRRWRPHRTMLVALLKIKNLLKDSYVSLGQNDQGFHWEMVLPQLKHLARPHEKLSKILEDNEKEILNIPPLYLDTERLLENQADLVPRTDYLYADSLVSIVNETNFYTDFMWETARFLSEKTFKPIAKEHPFIIVSVPNMLIKLKELGYKTFHPYIDETYDTILDDNERILKILDEIERISKFTQQEVESFIINVKPICEHNKNILLNKEQFVHRLNY